ncbi:hypothetical protein KF840_09265 [bacterium]|nr:hypothetical protein [bacterium]
MRRQSPSAAVAAVPVVGQEDKRLVDACIAGDVAARQRFHAEYLPLIYRFEGAGCEHEAATENFIAFLFDDDRVFHRLRGYRGEASLRSYLWHCILPDLMKQFRGRLRRQRLDTLSLDDRPAAGAGDGPGGDRERPMPAVAALLAALPLDKRVLVKLLHLEDFDFDAAELRFLADCNGWSLRLLTRRLADARESVRGREAARQARVDGAASAGQWIRLYGDRLQRLEEDLAAAGHDSPRAARLLAQRAELQRKLAKRERQRAELLRAAESTVVTLPTALIAELLHLSESTARTKISRLRRELKQIPVGSGPGDER